MFGRCTFNPIVLMLLAFVCGCGSESVEDNNKLSGVVSRVQDGDSIKMVISGTGELTIRLRSIDSPELDQPYGVVARDFLSDKISGTNIGAHCYKKDRYNREVCTLFTQQGEDINALMLSAGLAWHYLEFADEQSPSERNRYRDYEAQAKATSRGLWQDSDPVAPWVHRNQ